MINKFKLIFIYSAVLVYLISIGLTHLNPSFIALTLISMGFIFGFMANECFFNGKDSKDYWVYPNPYPITEGDTLSNIRTNYDRQMPSDPPPSLSKKESFHPAFDPDEENVKISLIFNAQGDIAKELEYLDSRKLMSRIRETVANHVREKIQEDPEFLKNIKVNFSYHSKTREQIINSMCLTYRHDYWLIKESKNFLGGMTEEDRKSLHNQMAKIFDNDIAPHMEFK